MRIKVSDIVVSDRIRKDTGDIPSLAKSIETIGLLHPIIIDSENRLISGARRLEAIKSLGWKEVEVRLLEELSDYERKLIELEENIRRKNLDWIEEVEAKKALAELLEEKEGMSIRRVAIEVLNEDPGNLSKDIALAKAAENFPVLKKEPTKEAAKKSFDKIREKLILREIKKRESKKPRVSNRVEIAEANYKIGDALKLLSECNNGTANFAEVDPPYAISLNQSKKVTSSLEGYEEIREEDYPQFVKLVAKEVYRILSDGYVIWWFGHYWYKTVYDALLMAGFLVNTVPCVWVKANITGQSNHPNIWLGNQHETFIVARKGTATLRKQGRSNVFIYEPLKPSKKIHPTEKPLELMIDILETFVYPGSSVLVPFLGSGSTLRACYKLGLKGWGYEISPKYKQLFLDKVFEDSRENNNES